AGVFVAGGLLLLSGRAGAITIVAGFAPSITNNPNAQQIETSIETATAEVGALFSNPGTVNILFQYRAASDPNDIGSSLTELNTLSYSDYTAKLTAASTADPDNMAYVSANISSDIARLHEQRAVSFGAVTDDLSAPFHQSATLASAEVDVPVAMAGGDLEPFLRVAYLANRQGGFREADSGAGLGLSVAPFSHENWTETAGGRWRRTYHGDDAWFAPEATAGFAFNALEDPPQMAAALQGAPANTGAFSISAAREAPLEGIIGAGIAAGLDGTPIVLHLDYEGRFSNRSSANSGLANLSYSW
ncbi:MAG: autotransporter outer membrane beta-barrel domain-containing protein, partial [Rhizobiaceae bacterium]